MSKRQNVKERTDKASQKWKCASIPPEKRKERIYVRALGADGLIVFEKSFGCKKWFRDLHPVVGENDFRRQHGIVKILMKRYGMYGELLHDIFHDYSPETGEYLYGECLHPNNTTTTY